MPKYKATFNVTYIEQYEFTSELGLEDLRKELLENGVNTDAIDITYEDKESVDNTLIELELDNAQYHDITRIEEK